MPSNLYNKNKKRPLFQAFFYLLITGSIMVCGITGCRNDYQPLVLSISGPTMGTQYHIKVVVENPDLAGLLSEVDLKVLVDDKLEAINASMSTYISDSELSLLNQAPIDQWLDVSTDLYELLLLSQKVSEASSGAFDISVGPLVNLWGFGPQKTERIPSSDEIKAELSRIGYDKLSIDRTRPKLKKRANLYLDLSSLAKGFATDLLSRDLRKLGYSNFMVEIGGELYVSGRNDRGLPWTIGVEKPSLLQEGSMQAIAVSNVGVATSGEYRNYYEVDGIRASHTIDPIQGKPIQHKLVSVTVISDMGGLSDAYATALNVLGPKAGYALAKDLNLAAYFVVKTHDGFDIKYTPQFTPYLVH